MEDLESFMNHQPNAGFSGAKFLKGWKKRTPPTIDIWLHTRALPKPVWQHQIPEIRQFQDRETGQMVRQVWGSSFNCLEPEAVLSVQNRRSQDGTREVPPTVCPICKLLEVTRKMVALGQLSVAEPLFRFAVEGGDEERVLTVGGMYNAFRDSGKHLSDDQKREVKRANIKFSEAWRENTQAKCNYVFTIVDNDNPSEGVQVAIETGLLGDKMKEVMRNQMKRLGKADGNPLLNPYCFNWEHRPNEKEFNKKYSVVDMPRIVLTEQVRDLIYSEDPPDIARIIAPGNVRKLRAQLEAYCLYQMPWDEIFDEAERQQANQVGVEEDASFDFGANVSEVKQVPPTLEGNVQRADAALESLAKPELVAPAQPKAPAAPVAPAQPKAVPAAPAAPVATAPAPATTRRKVEPPKPVAPPVATIPCDDCGHPMLETETKCPKCGAIYALDPDVTVQAAEEQAAKPATPPAVEKPKTLTDPIIGSEDEGDQIKF